MSKPRCEDIGFKHLWFEQGNLGPDWRQWNRERTCTNCGRRERRYIVQQEVTEWREEPLRPWEVPPDADG